MPAVPLRLADARITDELDPEAALVALRSADLPLIERWLRTPHVRRWRPHPPETELAEMAECISGGGCAPFLACAGARPVGYVQIYHANPEPFWTGHELPIETFGIDLMIGEADMVGLGWGPRFVRLANRRLFAMPHVVRIHIDPDPTNAAAIRAYEKAGFRRVRAIETPDGPALYMITERNDSA